MRIDGSLLLIRIVGLLHSLQSKQQLLRERPMFENVLFYSENRVTLLFRVVCIFCVEIVMEIYGAKELFE